MLGCNQCLQMGEIMISDAIAYPVAKPFRIPITLCQ